MSFKSSNFLKTIPEPKCLNSSVNVKTPDLHTSGRSPCNLIRSQILKQWAVCWDNWFFPLDALKTSRQQEIPSFVNTGRCACFLKKGAPMKLRRLCQQTSRTQRYATCISVCVGMNEYPPVCMSGLAWQVSGKSYTLFLPALFDCHQRNSLTVSLSSGKNAQTPIITLFLWELSKWTTLPLLC